MSIGILNFKKISPKKLLGLYFGFKMCYNVTKIGENRFFPEKITFYKGAA